MTKNNIKQILLNKKTQISTGVFLLLIFTISVILSSANQNSGPSKKQTPGQISVGDPFESSCDASLLTGQCLGGGDSEEMLFAVMIDNHPDALPQFGLSDAEVVYSTLVEGGITRFLAVFSDLSQAERIGPIRSARPYFLDIVSEIDPLYVHVGGSEEALSRIKDLETNDLNEMTSWGPLYFERIEDGGYFAPHNTFSSLDDLRQAHSDFGLSAPSFDSWSFDKEREDRDEDEKVSTIQIDYSVGNLSDVEYTYLPEEKVFHRHQNDIDYRDARNDQPIKVDNLIIQKVPREKILDSVGRQAIDLLGEGEALYFSHGQILEMTWQKETPSSRTKYFDLEGEEVKFNPGNFWIEIVPGDREVVYE